MANLQWNINGITENEMGDIHQQDLPSGNLT
jgi:hypothetical protein